MNIAGKKGLTLVEVLVVALLSTVVMAGIYSTFIVGNRAWSYYNDSVLIKKEARRALFRMASELREAENVRVIQSPDGNTLHFYREAEGPVTYDWSRTGKDADRVIRRDRVNSRIIAQYITELSYSDLKDAIVVDITASKQKAAGDIVKISLKEKIALREQTAQFK